MSRFFNRVLPLFLAVLFLLAAAGTSFFVVLGGSHVAAEDPGSTSVEASSDTTNPSNTSITKENTSITGVMAIIGEKQHDLLSEALPSGQEIDTLKITIHHDNISAADFKSTYQKIKELQFNSETFGSSLSFDSSKIELIEPTGVDSCTYTIKLSDITYNTGSELSLTITYADDKETSVNAAKSLKSPVDESYDIEVIQFLDNGKAYNSNIRYGMVLGLKVTIHDDGITETALNKQIDAGSVKVKFNNSNFELRNGAKFKIENIKGLASGGVSYNIVCKDNNIEYMGLNQQLALSIDYGNLKTRIVSDDIQKCIPKSDDSFSRLYDRYFDDDDDDDDESSRPDIAPPTPNIIITKYDYGGGNVTAAGKFQLKITFKNTSKKLPIDNIVMKVSVPEAFTMTSSSNTFYVEKLSRNSSVVRTMDLSVKPNAEPISHPIKIEFSFEAVIDEARKQFTSEEEISIPVAQLDRFSMNNLEYPEMIFVGEGTNIEATFINKGKTPVYNVSAEITGNISQPGQKQFIGNIEEGKEESADFMINADMPGEVSGEVIITYEDANMNIGELRSPFTLTAQGMDVMPPDDANMAMNPEEFEAESVKWYSEIPVWTWIVGGIVLIIIFAFVRKLIRVRHEKMLEEQDEDF